MSDVPTTPRKAMSPSRALRIWEHHKGVCVICKAKIRATSAKDWIIEHIIPLGLGGADEDANCGPAHEGCRRVKDKTDVRDIAKAKRRKAKHLGIRKRSTFQSKWKRKVSGETVLR